MMKKALEIMVSPESVQSCGTACSIKGSKTSFLLEAVAVVPEVVLGVH